MSLNEQWVAVTGGSRGIGLGVAKRFVDQGSNVIITGRNKDDLTEARQALLAVASHGQQVNSIAADLRSPDDIDSMFDEIRSIVPALNAFVANAGWGKIQPFLAWSLDEWNEIVALNFTGTFLSCQRAAQLMVDRPSGNRAIVIVSSIRATGARPGTAVYAATKAGVNQLARVAARELAPLGIRVNVVSPGITATPMSLEQNPQLFEENSRLVPMGRAGSVEEMADATVFLCSPASQFITGTNMVVDGGESLS